ncbi:XRE family transcriptional regulator [Klebsiella aerogenes]|jgi:transcriptional regulator with XRE-family HTH domain|uniref:helix-turn-helix domain-containing protein n=1 Tax=Klebsiella TaxID=570 RepID=UPI0009817D5C|nr:MULTISPECIES: helix-turn-helix domain-containing protein [Klebsiella]EIX9026395.1 XRE family transcriptional regulator [Klebsiella aerogenes]MDU9355296.1 XRE family transcriptional regulator [Klebsiella sp. 141153]MEB6655061.1 XRE family transcriptional regulator [Klebsiella aerogenes]OQR44802.1 hypothetical protein BW261_12890 [Klebsiella aerogenes]HBY7766510.1 XRE family transcriptional regulator [Klebsiella aerogenes]
MKTLSERLAYAMKETGFSSQTALAKASGVEQSLISKILRGSSETSKSSGKLAAAMGISADWLINGQGSIFGSSETKFEKVDASKQVMVWDKDGATGTSINWFNELPENFQAYIMHGKTGISQAPAGSIVIVDPDLKPSTSDLVVAKSGELISVFRYHINGAGGVFLSVDDDRVPLAEIEDTSVIRGTVKQIFIPELSK